MVQVLKMASNTSMLQKLLHKRTDSKMETIELGVLDRNQSEADSTGVPSSPSSSAGASVIGWKYNNGYQTLVDCSEKIIAGLSSEPKKVGDILHGKGFISTELLREITGLQATKTHNARKLYLCSITHTGAESQLIVPTSDLHQLDDSDQSLIPSSPHSAGNSPAEQVQHFEGRFHELRTCAITEVMDKHVPVARFRQTLMTLPNAISKEHEEFFIEKYSIFMQADSVEYIFLHLNFYLSFIDFSLLMHIIQHFGSSSLQQKMKQYSIDMETFRTETPVIDIIPYLSGRPEPPPHFTRLKMKLNFNVKTCTLEVLEQHRRKFGSEFSLSKFVLFLVELKEGSLVEVWLIPSNIIPTLKDRVQQKSLTFFHNLEILEFYVNEECLYPLHALEDASVRTLPVCLQTDLCLIENREEDVPVITPSRRRIWNEITSEIDSTPESRGLAFIATCFSASRRINSLEINSLLISNRTLASMFGRLKFAVFEKRIESQEELSDVIYIATSHLMRYPKSLHYSIVVVVAGWVEYNVNTLPTRQGKININSDLIEPFLPHSAPALVDIPKLFLINTVTLGDGPLDALGLNVPSEGNFLISYTNTSDRDITEVVEVLSVRLGNSHDSIEDVLTNVKEQMPHSTTMTVISTLNKPMYLNPDNSSKLKEYFDAKRPTEDITYHTVPSGNGFKSTVVLPGNIKIQGEVSKSKIEAKQSAAHSALSFVHSEESQTQTTGSATSCILS